MATNRKLLFDKLKTILTERNDKIEFDLTILLYLIERTVFNDPVKNCKIKGGKSGWIGLPVTKSLFRTKPDCSFPIGNPTFQLFANIYLNDFDHFVKSDLIIQYYARYVVDFVIIHKNKGYLRSLIPNKKKYLYKHLQLELHPYKIYLQHFSKGVKYLCVVIKPYRIYNFDCTKGNFFKAIVQYNKIARNHKPSIEVSEKFLSSMNSYLGIMKHYKTYISRKRFIIKISLDGGGITFV
ncbi:RNA-directed DNA polymerase [candidate division KSB1 bacterium]